MELCSDNNLPCTHHGLQQIQRKWMPGRTSREYQMQVIHITTELTSTFKSGKEMQRHFFLWRFKQAGPQARLANVCRTTTENIRRLSLVVNCILQERKDLASVIKTTQTIVGSHLLDLDIQSLPKGARLSA